jgi:hypothetical protein
MTDTTLPARQEAAGVLGATAVPQPPLATSIR